ncbi:MAG: ATP-binding protein [Flavobacteriales bacterium]|uniref:ATP-binding protein n=1 Tax=Sanyastnella coralliicola TaxID=3069118 RepID=UPI0027B8E2EC|nr:ATP-binding protein [Longitalea sp. SCSIO 12813]MCH2197293.1 ATP-binding protein [Flavobacteriales bacterium]
MTTPETGNVVRFASQTENIAIVEKLIDQVVENFKVTEDHYGNILISLTEAVNNAIVHGNKLDEEKQVMVRYEIDGKTLRFFIEDEGPGFDYDNLPDPTAPENREKPNGRGVFLMRNLADHCEFHDDGKLVQLEFEALA